MENRTLTIISLAAPTYSPDGTRRTMVNVQCFCGKEFVSYIHSINQGLTKSCGCLVLQNQIERFKKNPNYLSKHPLYRVWMSMKSRCYNEKAYGYKYYGGIGVGMCDEWLNDFTVFFKWCIENGWKKGMQVDKDKKPKELGIPARIYSPEMCSIVTPVENMKYTKSAILIPYKGESKTLSQWAKDLDIPYSVLYSRMKTQRMEPEKAFNMKIVEYALIDTELAQSLKDLLKEEGRTQRWLFKKLVENGCDMDEPKISNKLKGILGFTEREIEVINKLLGTSYVCKKIDEDECIPKHIR